jgi:hypothetical protein
MHDPETDSPAVPHSSQSSSMDSRVEKPSSPLLFALVSVLSIATENAASELMHGGG